MNGNKTGWADVTQFDETVEQRLTRYIANRNKRTGQTWSVTRRYESNNMNIWKRAHVTNEHGERVRIYHHIEKCCWVVA